jgi:hypothetical protein
MFSSGGYFFIGVWIMLKLTYTEDGLHLERAIAPLDMAIAQRVRLAMSAGQRLYIEPSQASFLLSQEAPGLSQLQRMLRMEQTQILTITPVDHQFVEVTVQGSWLAESAQAQEGIFVTALTDMIEFLVMRLWETTQHRVTEQSVIILDGG